MAAALLFVIFTAWPARAAIELRYFRASASMNTVLLEWATERETNISGFIIECKEADEPDSAYHAIGARDALGGPERGAEYSFNVAAGLVPGVSYCFRLVENTLDGLPGEQFELCGYGAAVTPTPIWTPRFGGFGEGPPVRIVVPPPVDNDVDDAPLFTPTPTPTIDPFAPLPTSTPIPPGPDSPLAEPTEQVEQEQIQQEQIEQEQMQPEQPESPLPVPEAESSANGDLPVEGAAAEQAPTPTYTPTPEQPESPPPAPTATLTPTLMPEEEGLEEAFLPGVMTDDDPDAGPDATPTPLYEVVTATPTAEAIAVAPTFTPWPTVTPQPENNVASLLNPSAQNLMVLLLCVIFLTASGLGTLGLVTSVIYMRSRAQREEYLHRLYGRRRH